MIVLTPTSLLADEHVYWLMCQFVLRKGLTDAQVVVRYPISAPLLETYLCNVSNWTRVYRRKYILHSNTIVCQPYCDSNHWKLLIVDRQQRSVHFIDPLGSKPPPHWRHMLRRWAVRMYSGYVQSDGYQCGVWIVILAYIYIHRRGDSFSFHHPEISLFDLARTNSSLCVTKNETLVARARNWLCYWYEIQKRVYC